MLVQPLIAKRSNEKQRNSGKDPQTRLSPSASEADHRHDAITKYGTMHVIVTGNNAPRVPYPSSKQTDNFGMTERTSQNAARKVGRALKKDAAVGGGFQGFTPIRRSLHIDPMDEHPYDEMQDQIGY